MPTVKRKTVLKQLATALGPAWTSSSNTTASPHTSAAPSNTTTSLRRHPLIVTGKRSRKPVDLFKPSAMHQHQRQQQRLLNNARKPRSSNRNKQNKGASSSGRSTSTRTRASSTTTTTSSYSLKRKRKPRHRREQEQKLNDAAHASRLHAHGLCQEEFDLFQYHIGRPDLENYLRVRNTMLHLWRESPKEPLTLAKAFEATKDEGLLQGLIPHVYEFLLRSGYINFGMCTFQRDSSSSTTTPGQGKADQDRKTIVVVGSGIAGVGVARQLENLFGYYADRFLPGLPPKVVVLEARSRIGGRMHTVELQTKASSLGLQEEKLASSLSSLTMKHAVDLGAQIITGFENGNPMEIIVRRQLTDLPLHYLVNETCDLFDHDGKQVAKEMDLHCEAAFNDILEKACRLRDHQDLPVKLQGYLDERVKKDSRGPGRVQSAALPTLGHSMDYFIEFHPEFQTWTDKELGLIHWHYANLEFANATPLDQLSLRHWDQDDDYEFSGPHCMVVQGYGQVPVKLSKGLDVRCNQPVASIKRTSAASQNAPHSKTAGSTKVLNKELIQVHCRDKTVYNCSAAIITVPLGVLKSGQIEFSPALPDWKQEAIQHLGFGLLNKLVLVFEKPFWDRAVELFGYVGSGREGSSAKGYDLKAYRSSRGKFYMFWNCIVVSGLPVLVTLMAGQSAYDCESMSKGDLVEEALETLGLIFPDVQPIPAPLETLVTRWSEDEFAKGSYSFVGKEGTGQDYDSLAAPVENQLYFAGEATSRHYPATAHGAYLSGIKVAKDILDSLIGPQSLDGRALTKEQKQKTHSHLRSMEDAHTATDSPPPGGDSSLDESSLVAAPMSLGHGFVLPRRRGRVSRSMIARFVAERSDVEDSSDEDGSSQSEDEPGRVVKEGAPAAAVKKAPSPALAHAAKLEMNGQQLSTLATVSPAHSLDVVVPPKRGPGRPRKKPAIVKYEPVVAPNATEALPRQPRPPSNSVVRDGTISVGSNNSDASSFDEPPLIMDEDVTATTTLASASRWSDSGTSRMTKTTGTTTTSTISTTTTSTTSTTKTVSLSAKGPKNSKAATTVRQTRSRYEASYTS